MPTPREMGLLGLWGRREVKKKVGTEPDHLSSKMARIFWTLWPAVEHSDPTTSSITVTPSLGTAPEPWRVTLWPILSLVPKIPTPSNFLLLTSIYLGDSVPYPRPRRIFTDLNQPRQHGCVQLESRKGHVTSFWPMWYKTSQSHRPQGKAFSLERDKPGWHVLLYPPPCFSSA